MVLHHKTRLKYCARLKSPSSSVVVQFLLFPSTSSTPISSLRHSPRSTTSSSAPLNITPCGTVTRNEDRGPVAIETPLTGYEPNLFDIPEDYDGIDEIFTDTNFTQLICDSDGQYPDPAEVDDEHLRSEFASPLQMQERKAKTDLTQTHHSFEESLLESVPFFQHER